MTTQLPREFLEALASQQNRETHVRITSLTFADELPVESIEGRVTQGSLNLDGKSALRRTASLTTVSQDLNIDNYLWGLNNKFKLELGVRNYSDPKYPDIIWFNYGKYVFTAFTPSLTANNYMISLNGQDKMCLLNGTVGGNLNALNYRFDAIEEEDADGNTVITKLPLKTIITEIVHKFGNEPYHNIIVNDLDDEDQLNLIQYIGDDYFYLGRTLDGDVAIQLTADTECSFKLNDKNTVTTTIEKLEESGGHYQLDSELSTYSATPVTIQAETYYIRRIVPGQTVGYTTQQLTYPKELTAKTGETVTSVLDKIKQIIPGYEYFYDVDGRFVFQRNKTGVELPYSTEIQEYVHEPSMFSSEIAFTFENNVLNTSFKDSPQYVNIKNDFSYWGSRTGAGGTAIPILYRYVVGKKPLSYTTISIDEADVDWFNETHKPAIPRTYDEYKGGITYTADEVNWREIIYQMALDQDRWGMYLDDFSIRLAAANPNLYPNGKTGYEPYYTDFLGFWRQIYDLNPEDTYSLFSIPSFGTEDYFNVTKDTELYTKKIIKTYDINNVIYDTEYKKIQDDLLDNLIKSDQALITMSTSWADENNQVASSKEDKFEHLKFILFLLYNHKQGFAIKDSSDTLADRAHFAWTLVKNFSLTDLEQLSLGQAKELLDDVNSLYKLLSAPISEEIYSLVPADLPINIMEGIQGCILKWNTVVDMITLDANDLSNIKTFIEEFQKVYFKTDYQYANEQNQMKHFKDVIATTKIDNILDRLSVVLSEWSSKILWYFSFNIKLFGDKEYIKAQGALLGEQEDNVKANIYPLTDDKQYYYYTNRTIYVPEEGLEIEASQAQNLSINYKIDKIDWSQADRMNLDKNIILYQAVGSNQMFYYTSAMQKLDNILLDFYDWLEMFQTGIIVDGISTAFHDQIPIEQEVLLRYDVKLGTINFDTNPWEYTENGKKTYLPILTSTKATPEELDNTFYNTIPKQMARQLFYNTYLCSRNEVKNIYKDDTVTLEFYPLGYLLKQLEKIDSDFKYLAPTKEALGQCKVKDKILADERPTDAEGVSYSWFSNETTNGLTDKYRILYENLSLLMAEIETKVIAMKNNYKYYWVVKGGTTSLADLCGNYTGTIILTPYLDVEKTLPVSYLGSLELVLFYSKADNINHFDTVTEDLGCTAEQLYNITGTEAEQINKDNYLAYPKYYDDNKAEPIYYYTKDAFWQEDGWNINIKTPELLNFWFDILDSDASYLGRYAVERIGNRTKSQNDTKTKVLFNYNVPSLILYHNENKDKINFREGYTVLQLDMNEEEFNENFGISSSVLSAKSQIESLMEKHLFKNSSLSITTMPIYHLEPNSRIRVVDQLMKISNEYVISKLTIPLTYNGTMTITGSLAPITIY